MTSITNEEIEEHASLLRHIVTAGFFDGTKLGEKVIAAAGALEALSREREWLPIEETVPTGNERVIIAVTGGVNPSGSPVDPIVGEAYRLDGEWWWAGTGPKIYHSDPISEINYGSPTHWRPLPPPPKDKEAKDLAVKDSEG